MMACTPPNQQRPAIQYLTSLSVSERLLHVCTAPGGCSDRPTATLAFLRDHLEHAVTLFSLCDALFGPEDTSADCCFVALEVLARTAVVHGLPLTAPKSTALTITASLMIGWKYVSRDADVDALVNVWNREGFLGGVHLDLREVAWQEWELLEVHHYRVAAPKWWAACTEIAGMFWHRDGGSVEGSAQPPPVDGGRLSDVTNGGHNASRLHCKPSSVCVQWQRMRARFALLLVTMQTLLLHYGRGVYAPLVASTSIGGSEPSDEDLMWGITRDACAASGVALPDVIASLLPGIA